MLTIEEIKLEQKQSKAEAIEEDEKYMESYQAIGAITPVTKNIRIRNKPSTSGEKLGVLKPLYDDDDTYFMTLLFYETAENDGYTWYRIGKDRWVADNGSWFEVELFEGQ